MPGLPPRGVPRLPPHPRTGGRLLLRPDPRNPLLTGRDRTVNCTAEQGQCDRDAVAYVFGRLGACPDQEGRMTVVAGPRGRWLADKHPDGARCVDHALDDLEALVTATLEGAPT